MAKKVSKLHLILQGIRDLLEERNLDSRWHRFAHFWLLVCRSFSKNRCPVRASALAYSTLLALIPTLAIAMSVASTFLKSQGEAGIEKFIVRFVDSLTPPAPLGTNREAMVTSTNREVIDTNLVAGSITNTLVSAGEPGSAFTNGLPHAGSSSEANKTAMARRTIASNINQFIQNTQSGTLGVTGTLVLIFVAISMLSRIETTFNDIWGVARGRSWFMRIVLYWGVISLTPILMVVAVGLATGPHLDTTKSLISHMPYIGSFLFGLSLQLLPIVLLCLSFGAFYKLIPNTRVDWGAALVGGLVGGLLTHANNAISVLYVSRVVSNSKIYGSLGLIPVFMIGLYFAWLLLLFGAQVAYAYQNRSAYLEEKQVESINQRGREFVALRLMTLIGQRFVEGARPPSIGQLSAQLGIPTRLVRQIMQTLANARLVAETNGTESSYLPVRPLERITCHDILQALRSGQGQELSTREEPVREEVLGEFQKIQEAERQAAGSVTMLDLVRRAQSTITAGEVQVLE